MANNLVTIITQIFGAQMITRVATSLGISPALAQTLANAAVPTVLAALGGVAATPGGAQKIADQIQSQDSNILGSLVNSLGSAGQSSFLSSGTGMLSSLLGSGAAGSLSGALAKFTGAEPAQAQSMLGIVTPATFGALAQQDPQIWSSGEGIAGLFAREQSAITAAIPAGLGSALGATGLFKNMPGIGSVDVGAASVTNTAARVGDAAMQEARKVGSAVESAGRHTADAVASAEKRAEAAASGLPGWLKIAVPVALIAALAWFLLPSSTPTPPAPAPRPAPAPAAPPAQTQAPAAPSVATQAAAQLAEFAQKANATVGTITTSLSGITNADQARAASPQLEQAASELNGLSSRFAQLPAEARTALSGPMQSALGMLNTQAARVLAIPGAAEVLKPVVDKITSAANSFKN